MANAVDLTDFYTRLRKAVDGETSSASPATLPPPASLQFALSALPSPSSDSYLAGTGAEATLQHILGAIAPALNGQALSSRYFGFVTGGTLPIAEAADNVVSALDQNLHGHLPGQTIATTVESAALEMLAQLLGVETSGPGAFAGRIFTTGATASNILGLACGREAVVAKRLPAGSSVGELGILAACAAAGVKEIQVLTSMGHSSLSKAAGIVGLGRASVKELPRDAEHPWMLDLARVEAELRQDGVASIIAVSAGEVNTGGFALEGRAEMEWLRGKADEYGAWIHVDGGESFRSWKWIFCMLTGEYSFRNVRKSSAKDGAVRIPACRGGRLGTCRQYHSGLSQALECGK